LVRSQIVFFAAKNAAVEKIIVNSRKIFDGAKVWS